ncbi:MAG: tRNA (adenosine(37)-N6)-threonylcarbamoyltransferase complex ATPase subunit type 1 TsaE [Nitrosomonadales bacterium]|nr:tRNA (adenosine(37)-N6)-threonylcarbamoyltransferase complex ATPase subunit type 1 TsaE [Nitrosomonadales bacterium]
MVGYKPASGQVAGYPPQSPPLSNSLPQAGERTNEKGNLESSVEGTNDRCANLSFHLADENATIALARRLAARLKPGMVIYLQGDLGAGKTTLVRGVLDALGYAGRVKSPTYTLVEPYHASGLDLRHFDLYRLHDEEEWEAAGFRDEFDGHNIFFIEWPEKAQGLIPQADVGFGFEILMQGRKVKIHANTEMGKQCLEQL